MRFPSVLAVLAAAVLAAATADGPARGAAATCTAPRASAAYTARTLAALRSGRDVWGDALLRAPGGPTYARASGLLAPLLYARGPGGRPLTASGVYYLPFAQPDGPQGAGSVALHVADGSQIVAQHMGGRALTVFVGDGGERYGSCLARLATPALAEGWLPVLETRYVDALGARYRQTSFAARTTGGGPLLSFVRVVVDARRARSAVQVRLAPAAARYRVARGATRTVYAVFSDATGSVTPSTAAAFAAARGSLEAYWRGRLATGMRISVPEARVENAERALLVQDLELTWRYSIGNPYEEFSFPESVDVAQVLAEHGFGDVARSILQTSLTRKPTPYPNWKKGERLLASAEYVRLSADAAYLQRATPVLAGFVAALGRQIERGGLLGRERYSSDIPNAVLGFHSQAVVWEGLRAIADAWAEHGQAALATRARALAARLERSLRSAVARSARRLPDGSLFLPAQLLGGEAPYPLLTDARLGSYWNLVVPYALASGFVPPGSDEARRVFTYLRLHGSRLLGLVRAGGYALYGRDRPSPVSGTDEVYGINVARFLADNDQADQLVLSLYGDLAAGMTPGTFVSGEAATVAPLDGERYRSMYLPPNGASNAAFLETLSSLLVHETRDAQGRPHGLRLAYATPRAWLRPGRRIAVTDAPTSFGTVSYALAAAHGSVHVAVEVPDHTPPSLSLRLRLPAGERVRSVTLHGRPFGRVDRQTGTLNLSGLHGTLDLVAVVAPR